MTDTMDVEGSPGTKVSPIARETFVNAFGPVVLANHHQTNTLWVKRAPVLVLPFNPEDSAPDFAAVVVRQEVRAVIKTKTGQTYEEAMSNCQGKNLIFNFATPSLECYPKKDKDCEAIYDPVTKPVPNELIDPTRMVDFGQALINELRTSGLPESFIETFTQEKIALVQNILFSYRAQLGRRSQWYFAVNDPKKTSVMAIKMTAECLHAQLPALGVKKETVEQGGGLLYRVETFDPNYAFTIDDWVLMDIDWEKNAVKRDKGGLVLVRSVAGSSFDSTYAPFTHRFEGSL